MKGVIAHEMAHLYDYHTYGDVGYDGFFSKFRHKQPTEYGDRNYAEVWSTVIEQVSTGKLRQDAQLPNGTRAFDDRNQKWRYTYEFVKD